MITLTPLVGSSQADEDPASSDTIHAQGPLCYLLQLDETKVLLDLGGHDPRKKAKGEAQDQDDTASASDKYEYETNLRELAPSISLVLLSHSSERYLSLYPYARKHWGLKCPVYATQPTVEMGRVVCLEQSMGWRGEIKVDEDANDVAHDAQKKAVDELFEEEEPEAEPEQVKGKQPLKGPFICTPDEINEAFNWIKAIRYNQPVHMTGILSHLLLTPYSSGHTLGGTIFKLRSPTSGTIVYATGLNHTTERHLDATVLLGGGHNEGKAEGLMRPDLLVVEGGRSLVRGAKQKDRAQALLELITTTLQSDRSLLFPVDASPRLLELLILLDQHWSYQISKHQQSSNNSRFSQSQQQQAPWNYPLCIVSRTGSEMLAFAKSLMEWMGGSVAKEEEESVGQQRGSNGKRQRDGNQGPLAFRHVRFFPTAESLMDAFPRDAPKLVVAVPMTMSYGPSRLFFKSMAADEGNVVVLTGRSDRETLSQELFEQWNQSQVEDERYGMGKVGKSLQLKGEKELSLNSKVALEGEELEAHQAAIALAKEQELAKKTAQERSKRMLEADDLESDSDDSDASDADMELGDLTGVDHDGNNGAGNELDSRRIPGIGNAFLEGEDARTTSFDIYVKGQQTRSTGFFRAGGNQANGGGVGGGERFRMFPFVERKGRKVDVYGEMLDLGQWLRKGREIEEETESEEVREAKRRKKEEDEKQKEPVEPPSKYVTETFTVALKAKLIYIDMEGQHDGRAIKTIIPSINPRRVIIVNSTPSASSDLLLSLQATLPSLFSSDESENDVHVPKLYESVMIGEETTSFGVNVGEGLLNWVNGGGKVGASSNGRWSRYEDYDIAMIHGRLIHSMDTSLPLLELPSSSQPTPESTTTIAAKERQPDAAVVKEEEVVGDVDDNGDEDGDETGDQEMPDIKPFYSTTESSKQPPASSTPASGSNPLQPSPLPLPQSLYIGTLRLTALKTKLTSIGIPVEFVGEGTLICGFGLEAVLSGSSDQEEEGKEVVVIKKNENGEVEVEGNVVGGDHAQGTNGKSVMETVREIVFGGLARVVV